MSMGQWRGLLRWKIWSKKLWVRAGMTPSSPLRTWCAKPDGGLVMRGSINIGDVEELLGVEFADKTDAGVTTIAGLLSHVSGNVPEPGDKIDMEGFKFEVLESNQRKILRVQVKKSVPAVMSSEEVQ